MEFLFDIIFEIIVEGSLELSTTKKVPTILRILAAIVFIAIYGGLIALFFFFGIKNRQPLLILLGIGVSALVVFAVRKYIRKNK